MLKSIQGFELKTREAIDNRLVLSKLEMLNINDNQMPEKYFAICTDDGYLYIFLCLDMVLDNSFLETVMDLYSWSVWQFIQVPDKKGGYKDIPGGWHN